MKKMDLRKYNPPWAAPGDQFLSYLPCLLSISVFLFALNYSTAYLKLFSDGVLIPGKTIAPFRELIDDAHGLLRITALFSLCDIYPRWTSYRRESRADYLMKRLPDRGLMWRTCWVVPAIRAAITALFSLVLTGVGYAVYIFVTPPACLPGV